MRLTILIGAAAVALAAGCDRGEPARSSPPPSSSSSSSPSSSSASGGATTSTTPAPPSQAGSKDGTNPTQGQVDPKHAEQHKDFQQRGDGAGPTSPDTKPKTGN